MNKTEFAGNNRLVGIHLFRMCPVYETFETCVASVYAEGQAIKQALRPSH